MPNGIPVATVALNAAKNAGLLAAQILGTSDHEISNKLIAYKADLKRKIEQTASEVENPKIANTSLRLKYTSFRPEKMTKPLFSRYPDKP